MPHWFLRWACLALALALGGSAQSPWAADIPARKLKIEAKPLGRPHFTASRRLRYVAGWELAGSEPDFGGLSALAAIEGGLVLLGDKGSVVRIALDARGRPGAIAIAPLPAGCANGGLKSDRDSESLTRDARGGWWIGFEWRNALCLADERLVKASDLISPSQMRGWPLTGGPEAIAMLPDGRLAVFAEQGRGSRATTPLLVFAHGADRPAVQQQYKAPSGYRPVDAAVLPGGNLLVLHRRFRFPLDFAAILSEVDIRGLDGKEPVTGRPLALLKAPGIADNFEGVAVQTDGVRTYIWMVSDDNFVPSQTTYLLKFELLGGSSVR